MKEKKILLIHPKGTNWIPGEKDMSRLANIMPPLGLCYLSSWLEKHGYETFIHDCYAYPLNDDKICELIKSQNIKIVGFSTTTSSFLDAIRIANLIKEIDSSIKIIFGGVHISALKEKLHNYFSVIDYGIIGEGEITILELLENNFSNLKNIKGLLYCKDDKIIFTNDREPEKNIDIFPFPAYEKLHGFPKVYQLPIFNYPKYPNTTAISSRGCPYQCSYCDRSVFKKSFRFNSSEYMFEMSKYLNQKFNIKHINFYDDLFTFNKKRIIEFCEKIINSNLNMTFNCASRAEHLDDEILKIMKRAGFWMISLGIETGDPEILKFHRSNNNLEKIKDKIKLIKKHGIRVKGLFMLGLPLETEQSIQKSMDFVYNLDLDDFNLAKFTPFPGSPIYEKINNYGTFKEDWKLMNCLNFVFIPNGLTKELLETKFKEFYRNYYERFKILFKYFTMLWKSPHSWIRFLKNFKDFYSFSKSYDKK